MNVNLQQSIARTRRKLHEVNRLASAMVRRIKNDKERANADLEMLLDDIVAETGIKLTPENLPTLAIYVQDFLREQRRKKAEAENPEPDFDNEAMKEFPL